MKKLFGLGVVLSLLFGGFWLAPVDSAEAATPSNFNRGYIISDGVFYNGSDMTTSEVQSFLNQQVPRCTLGDSGREKGKPWYWVAQTYLAQDCLKDAKFKSVNRAADIYCKAYAGKNSETAAEIIVKVGAACGINPKVLLVNLQKEQSLITDSWPTELMFDAAMGYGCPDSGPNYSPQCDEYFYGFFNQVYNAARQFKRYKLDTDYFTWFPVNRVTNIQYGVDPACGSKAVHISNYATAALYYYTPYTPHDDLLAGKGYSCSRGGDANINFYNIFTNWFGNPVATIAQEISGFYDSNKSVLGEVVRDYSQFGEVKYQEFERGAIAWTPSKQILISGGIFKHYASLSGPTGAFGYPVSDMESYDFGWYQRFSKGTIYWLNNLGPVTTHGAINSFYNSLPDSSRYELIGLPTAEMENTGNGVWIQRFEHNVLAWTAASGVIKVDNQMHEAIQKYGGLQKTGAPLEEKVDLADGTFQNFRNFGVFLNEATSESQVLTGGIRNTFVQYSQKEELGYPLSGEFRELSGVWKQEFQNGFILWASVFGGKVFSAETFGVYSSDNYVLGNPKSDVVYLDAGRSIQEFDKAYLVASDSEQEPLFVTGGIRTNFNSSGKITANGLPTTNERLIPGSIWIQYFENNVLAWSKFGGNSKFSHKVAEFLELNDMSIYGQPTGDETVINNSEISALVFTNGIMYFDSQSDPLFVSGGIKNEFILRGAIPVLGKPIDNQTLTGPGEWAQEFENGKIIYDIKNGAKTIMN